MAYNDEALKAKLSTLNETQDSIVSVSQWITFHKRHADRIAAYWLTRLRDSPPAKRLNFIYLVNDIVQNARARKRAEFPDAFSPLMPEAIQVAYRSSTPDVQSKIRRVVEVWQTRNVFEVAIQQAIDARLDEVDKSKGSLGKKTLGGTSLFNSSTSASGAGMPKELETLAPLQVSVSKATLAARPLIDTAQTEYMKVNDPDVTLPSPPVHAARLSSLMKALANAETSVSASIKARQALVADLERILDINKSALAKDEETFLDLSSRRTTTEAKKREVEDNIMRGLSDENNTLESSELAEGLPTYEDQGTSGARSGTGSGGRNGSMGASSAQFNFSRPDFEELTPEPEEYGDDAASFGGDMLDVPQPPVPQSQSPPEQQFSSNPRLASVLAGFVSPGGGSGSSDNQVVSPGDQTQTLMSKVRPASSEPGINGSTAKRRKISHAEETAMVPDLGEMGMGIDEAGQEERDVLGDLDADVSELIRQQQAS